MIDEELHPYEINFSSLVYCRFYTYYSEIKILKLCSFWLSKIIDRLKYADLKIFNIATILKLP